MRYSIINRDDVLHIVDDEAFSVYQLDDQSLQKISFKDGAVCSASIFYLASYGIVPTYVLYEIASYIQKKYPQLQIDWFTTFYFVEKNSYLNIAFQMKEMLENSRTESQDLRLCRFIEFEERDDIENLNAIILKIAMMNIINFDVKIK